MGTTELEKVLWRMERGVFESVTEAKRYWTLTEQEWEVVKEVAREVGIEE